ncbi:MAG: lysophospholipid acyltransferase family protein [Caldilineaceae bacterium]|nr:lysophospholipid acyltransferase family protein [Caldilineaceae bacterium]
MRFKVPADASRLWRSCYRIIYAIRPLFCSLQVEGVENVPPEGGVVLACNHPGGLDSFILGFTCPRQVYYMAKRELFNVHPVMTYLLYRIGAFPINRGASDTAAIEFSIKLVREGRVLGMFPEGTRNRGKPLRRGKSGAVRIAIEADAPVVPVTVLGIPHLHRHWYNPFRRTRIAVRFGQPFHFSSGTVEDVAEYTHEVMRAMARMMPPELRGHYSEDEAPAGANSQNSTGGASRRQEGIEAPRQGPARPAKPASP